MEKEKILVSACLLGQKVRYDGKSKEVKGLIGLTQFFDLIPMCPELSGGLKIPRPSSEIMPDGRVLSKTGKDVTENYLAGAYWALSICQIYHIRRAILKEKSPSCGTHLIHDGSFSDKVIPGMGITARKLKKAGIEVLNEEEGLSLLKSLTDGKKSA